MKHYSDLMFDFLTEPWDLGKMFSHTASNILQLALISSGTLTVRNTRGLNPHRCWWIVNLLFCFQTDTLLQFLHNLSSQLTRVSGRVCIWWRQLCWTGSMFKHTHLYLTTVILLNLTNSDFQIYLNLTFLWTFPKKNCSSGFDLFSGLLFFHSSIISECFDHFWHFSSKWNYLLTCTLNSDFNVRKMS